MSARKKSRNSSPGDQENRGDAAVLAPYLDLLPPGAAARLLQAIRSPLPTAIRLNPLKLPDIVAFMRNSAIRYGWTTAPLPICPTGFILAPAASPFPGGSSPLGSPGFPTPAFTSPSRTIEYRLGQFFIQEAASMLPVELFTPGQPNPAGFPLVLDLAAAPGGKTTHLASRWLDRALVIANDPAAGRLPALRRALQDWGAANVAVTNFPGEGFGAWFPGTFDAVLLDAPCSMENLHPGSPQATRSISPRERQGLAQRQLRLLVSGFKALRTGGQMVFATCTLAPEEDEAVLDGLLRLYPGQARIEAVPWTGEPAPALAGYQGTQFHPSVRQAIRLWPHIAGTSGFFCALLTKLDAVEAHPQEPPRRSLLSAGFTPLSTQEGTVLAQTFAGDYGFDLAGHLASQRLILWRRGATLHTLPETYLTHFANLPCSSLGLPLGDESPDGLIVSHAWAARYGSQLERGRYLLPEEFTGRWLNGEDLRGLPQSSGHRVTLIVTDSSGRNLGRGRFSGDRLRNLLPKK